MVLLFEKKKLKNPLMKGVSGRGSAFWSSSWRLDSSTATSALATGMPFCLNRSKLGFVLTNRIENYSRINNGVSYCYYFINLIWCAISFLSSILRRSYWLIRYLLVAWNILSKFLFRVLVAHMILLVALVELIRHPRALKSFRWKIWLVASTDPLRLLQNRCPFACLFSLCGWNGSHW